MFRQKGASIGEKHKDADAEMYSEKRVSSEELDNYISALVDSVHGKCANPSIITFIERSSTK